MIAGNPDANCAFAVMSAVCDKMSDSADKQNCHKGSRDAHLLYLDRTNTNAGYLIGMKTTLNACVTVDSNALDDFLDQSFCQ